LLKKLFVGKIIFFSTTRFITNISTYFLREFEYNIFKQTSEGGGIMTTNYRVPNRLVKEKSPYLLQHAYNPVDWFPWGPEAFEKARQEDKPIFLSIGYS